jgi:hypothetical protein
MEHRDTLLTIAEIAVALAGFASIVTVIAHRVDDRSRTADTARLRMMLEVALRNAGFAVLPLPFLQLAPSDPILWRISSGLYLVAALVHGVVRLRSQRGLNPRWFTIALQVLLAMTAIASLANVLGLGGASAFSLYLASLLFGLSAAGLAFLTVAVSAIGGTRM